MLKNATKGILDPVHFSATGNRDPPGICVTLREKTGRSETIEAGANILAGTDATRIIGATGRMLSIANEWKNPYGDGNAGERIVGICSGKNE